MWGAKHAFEKEKKHPAALWWAVSKQSQGKATWYVSIPNLKMSTSQLGFLNMWQLYLFWSLSGCINCEVMSEKTATGWSKPQTNRK